MSRLKDLTTDAAMRGIIPDLLILGAYFATQSIWNRFSRLEDMAKRENSE
jgi:hypothetical protein